MELERYFKKKNKMTKIYDNWDKKIEFILKYYEFSC